MVPPKVFLIVSIATDHPNAKDILANAKEQLPFDEQFVELGPLDQSATDKMVRAICNSAGRSITAAQRKYVLQTYSNTGQVSVNKKIYKRFFFLTQV
jgi:hypothetical protein